VLHDNCGSVPNPPEEFESSSDHTEASVPVNGFNFPLSTLFPGIFSGIAQSIQGQGKIGLKLAGRSTKVRHSWATSSMKT
jgi:hypothetical protein